MNRNWYRGIIGMEDCTTGKCKADRGFCLLHISLPPLCICGGEEVCPLRMQDKFVFLRYNFFYEKRSDYQTVVDLFMIVTSPGIEPGFTP